MDFGEVVEPVSRAFWDNYDEPEDNEVYEDPTWKWFTESKENEVPSNKPHVLILEGVGEFTQVLSNLILLCQLSSGTVSVFDLPNSPILVVASQEKRLNLFARIVELLEPFIRPATQVTTLTVQTVAQHKKHSEGPAEDPVCYLRALNGNVEGITTLEVPNIMTGVAAGVAVWRKIKKLEPANNYIAFMEAVVFDSSSTEPLIKLLKKLKVPCVDSFTKRFKDESNLYL